MPIQVMGYYLTYFRSGNFFWLFNFIPEEIDFTKCLKLKLRGMVMQSGEEYILVTLFVLMN